MYILTRQNAPPSLAPPRTIVNYDNPDSIGDRIVISHPILGSLALIFVGLRVLVKWRIVKSWGWEDVYIILALLFTIARIVVEILNVELYQLGIHVWDIKPENLIYIGNHGKNGIFIGDMLYFLGIMFTKISIPTLYLKIFVLKKLFRFLCYGMMAFIVIYLIMFFFLFAFNCNPPARTWHLIGWTGGGTCFDNIKTSYAVGGINIFTDVVLLIMPLPVIYQLRLSFAQKVGILAIFGTGIIVVICTIVREVIIVQTLRDFEQNRAPVPEIIWLTAELCVGIICACLPTLGPLYTRKLVLRLVPNPVLGYLRTWRSVSKSNKSINPSTPVGVINQKYPASSDIELLNPNVDTTPSYEHIQQTRDYIVKYATNEEGLQQPGARFNI